MDSLMEVVNADAAMYKELPVLFHKLNSSHQNIYLNILATHQMVCLSIQQVFSGHIIMPY